MKYRAKLPEIIDGYYRKYSICHMHANHKGCVRLIDGDLGIDEYMEIDTVNLLPMGHQRFIYEEHFFLVVTYCNRKNEVMSTCYPSFYNLTNRNFLVKWWDGLFEKSRLTNYISIPKVD